MVRPKALEDVKETRAHGDLSENFEYKAAKQALNKNKGRIRYLEKMMKTAHIIEDRSADDEVGLYDKVTLLFIDDGDTEVLQVVTTVRTNPLDRRISKESPLGSAILGKRVGEQVTVSGENGTYSVVIKAIEKAEDDGSAPLL